MLNAFVLEGYVSSELAADVTADGHPKVSFQVACLRDPFGKRRRIVADYIRLYAYGKMTTVLRNANLSRGTHITAHTRIKSVRLFRNGRAYYHMEPVIERIYFNRVVADAPDVDFDAEERDSSTWEPTVGDDTPRAVIASQPADWRGARPLGCNPSPSPSALDDGDLDEDESHDEI